MNKKQTYTILLSGDVLITPRLKSLIDPRKVIAADSGIRHARALDVLPQLWVGDFDSSNENLKQLYSFVERHAYPSDKDKTDGEIAIEAALKAGADRLILCGAMGGRSDQVLGHMTMALRLASRAIPVLLTSGYEEGYPLTAGTHQFDLPPNTLFSINGFNTMEEVSIKGAKWCLHKATLPFGHGLAISNLVVADLEISLKQGMGMLIASLADFPAP